MIEMSTFESVLASISEVLPWCIVIICVRFNIIWCKVMRRVIDPKSGHFLAPILRVPATKLSNFWREKKPVMLLSISLDKFKILISLQGVQKIMRIFTSFYSDYSNFLIKYGFYITWWPKKSLWQSFKNRKSEMTVEKYLLFALLWCIQIFL